MTPRGSVMRGAAMCLALALLPQNAATGQIGPQSTPQPARPSIPAKASTFRWTGTLSQGGLILGTAPAGARAVMLDGHPVALSPDGRFLVGFDRDAGPRASLTATLPDGHAVTQDLTIAPLQHGGSSVMVLYHFY